MRYAGVRNWVGECARNSVCMQQSERDNYHRLTLRSRRPDLLSNFLNISLWTLRPYPDEYPLKLAFDCQEGNWLRRRIDFWAVQPLFAVPATTSGRCARLGVTRPNTAPNRCAVLFITSVGWTLSYHAVRSSLLSLVGWPCPYAGLEGNCFSKYNVCTL